MRSSSVVFSAAFRNERPPTTMEGVTAEYPIRRPVPLAIRNELKLGTQAPLAAHGYVLADQIQTRTFTPFPCSPLSELRSCRTPLASVRRQHRLAAERMNRTIKEATVKRLHYESHDQLRTHHADFIDAYNFTRWRKTLSGSRRTNTSPKFGRQS